MKSFLKAVLLANILTLSVVSVSAQDMNPITTAVPSLIITPDARSGGMGDAGVATAPDVYSQHWNPAKYAFIPSKAGFGISYTPWLRKIVNDIALVYGVGYYKLGNENNQALSASVRYFSIGDVDVTNALGEFQNVLSPNELSIDLGYSRKLTETFSGAVAVRYIRADYSNVEGSSPGDAFAADIAGYNESYINIGQSESLLSFGFNISNIGTKISTDGDNGPRKEFLPTNLRIGASLMYPVNDVSTLSFSLDMNKYLVPTPPVRKDGETSLEFEERLAKYRDTNSISGIFKSFGDAPGGFSEELKEIMWSIGAEYDYDNKFRLRTGYFYENKMKGNRQYLGFGAGFKLTAFQLDVAYMLATAQQNPLDQTLRFSLAFDIDAMKNLFK